MTQSRARDYLEHIRQAATDACGFVAGMDKQAFMHDKRTQQAVVMSLVIIGEAATKLMDADEALIQAHSHVPWRAMRGMRNRMTHGYFDINLDLVWDTVQVSLPALIEQLRSVDTGPASV